MMTRKNTSSIAVLSSCLLRSVRRMIPLLLFPLLLHRGVSNNHVCSFTIPVRRHHPPSARIQRTPVQRQADDADHDYFDVRILEEMQQRQQKQRLRRNSRGGGDELDNLLNSNPSTAPPPPASLQTATTAIKQEEKSKTQSNKMKNSTTNNTNDAFHNRKYTEEMQRRQAKKQQQQQKNGWNKKHQELDDVEMKKKEHEQEKIQQGNESKQQPPVITKEAAAAAAAAQPSGTTATTSSTPMTTPSSSSGVGANIRPPLSSPVVAVVPPESKQIRTKTSRRLLAAQQKSQRRKAQNTPKEVAPATDATSVALLGQELATLERQMVRLDGYESYVLPSMVVAGTSFATINVDAAVTVLDGTIILLSGWSALCGVYTTIIFTLTMVYGKLALNQEKEDEFDYFMDTTSVQRYRGFQAFLVSLILFNINIFLIGVDHIPTTIGLTTVHPGYKLGFGLVAMSVVFFVYREMDTIIQSATPIFTTTSTTRAAPSSPIEYNYDEDGNDAETNKTIRVVRRIQYIRDTNFHPKQQRSLLEQNMKKYRLFRKLREKQINNTYIQKKIVPLFMKKNNVPSTLSTPTTTSTTTPTTTTTTSRTDPSQQPDDRSNTSPDNHDQETK